jgi:hypothetical protein
VNVKLRRQLKKRKRRIEQRIDKANWSGGSPMIQPPAIGYELAERQLAIDSGGLGAVMNLVKQLDLRRQINASLRLLKICLPYDEADHVLNIALNLLAGGSCLEHLELRRTDEAYLNALGAERIPDPTTAGDFCRRFSLSDIMLLMQGFNRVRQRVWQEQPDAFFDLATIDADGTMVETCGQRKEGIGMNYKKQWGYHPLLVTLANTGEPLFIANRGGNRPSHESAAFFYDLAIQQCRQAGFRKIRLRGDTDFSLTENFDGWDAQDIEFVFGIDAMPNLVKIAEDLENTEWKPLRRRRPAPPKSGRRRRRKTNHKQAFVQDHGYTNKRLQGEWIAEFDYQPTKCSRTYRVIAVRKEVEVTAGQQKLFDDTPYLFYITNAARRGLSARQVVFAANDRCDQENIIRQLKACGALAAPLDTLNSNGAYMAITSLAWSLKAWSALMIRPGGTPTQKEQQTATKRRVLRMGFHTFRQSLIQIPAQIIRRSRQLIYRLLSYRPSIEPLLLIQDNVVRPLRC